MDTKQAKNKMSRINDSHITDDIAKAIVGDIARFPKIAAFAFDIWEAINNDESQKDIGSRYSVDRTTISRFKTEVVDKYGTLNREASENVLQCIKLDIQMAALPRVNAVAVLNTSARFGQKIIADSFEQYSNSSDVIKGMIGKKAMSSTMSMDVLTELQAEAVKRGKVGLEMFLNSVGAIKKLTTNEDIEYIELTNDLTDEEKEEMATIFKDMLGEKVS